MKKMSKKTRMDYFAMALTALDEPSTYRMMNEWCWTNVKGWVKMAPTPAEFGGLIACDPRFVSLGRMDVLGHVGHDAIHLWALKVWVE